MHTVLRDSNSVECEPGNRQGLTSGLQSLELFHSVLLNVQGLTKEKRVVLSKLIEKFVLVGLTETHCMYESFAFPGWTVYAAPRTVQRAKCESHCGGGPIWGPHFSATAQRSPTRSHPSDLPH